MLSRGCPAGYESSDDDDLWKLESYEVDDGDDFRHAKITTQCSRNLPKKVEIIREGFGSNPVKNLMFNDYKWNKNSFSQPSNRHFHFNINSNYNRAPTKNKNRCHRKNYHCNSENNVNNYPTMDGQKKSPMMINPLSKQDIKGAHPLPDSHWFNTLIEIFKDNRNIQMMITNEMNKCWKEVPNPFSTAIFMIEQSPLLPIGQRAKFMNLVLKSLESWKVRFTQTPQGHILGSTRSVSDDFSPPAIALTPTAGINLDTLLTDDIKLRVITATTSNSILPDLNLLAVCFNLKGHEDPEYINIVHELVERHDYVKASRCITMLNIQKHFPSNLICLPLLCQGHIAEMERYLHNQPEQQIAFLRIIDRFLQKPELIDHYLGSTEVPRLRRDNLSQKSLFKLGLRLVKLYKFDEKICPHISFIQTCKGIKYLVVKRFLLKEIDCVEWEELVLALVGSNVDLQLFLVNQLVDQYELTSAVNMATKLRIKPDLLPGQIKQDVATILSNKEKAAAVCDENRESDNQSEFHQLELAKDAIVWVDDRKLLEAAIIELEKAEMIGFDSEWRPAFGGSTYNTKISLMQLATPDKVYLIDVMMLLDQLPDDEWMKIFTKIFVFPNKLIICYGHREDFNMLGRTFPSFKVMINRFNVLDLEGVHAKLQEETLMIDGWKRDDRGLSDLVARCLGKPLDKSQQISDWQRRPLRDKQLSYAALDAYCLLDVYNFLLINNPSIMEEALALKNLQLKGSIKSYKYPGIGVGVKNSHEKLLQKKDEVLRTTQLNRVAVADIKFVCDTVLIGLGKELRVCGVNTFILDHDDAHEKAASIALKDERTLLSSGLAFELLSNNMKSNQCYCVESKNVHEQLFEVLDKFNIKVTDEDMFSRCQACNHNKFMKISQTEMKYLWVLKRIMMDLQVPKEVKNIKQMNQVQIINILTMPLNFSGMDDTSMSSHDDDSETSLMDIHTYKKSADMSSSPLMRSSVRSKDVRSEDLNQKLHSALSFLKLSNVKPGQEQVLDRGSVKSKDVRSGDLSQTFHSALNSHKVSNINSGQVDIDAKKKKEYQLDSDKVNEKLKKNTVVDYKGISNNLENDSINLRECEDLCLLNNTAGYNGLISNPSDIEDPSNRNFHFSDINLDTFIIGDTQAVVQCEWMPVRRLNEIEEFLICTGCGKVYWDRMHTKTSQNSQDL